MRTRIEISQREPLTASNDILASLHLASVILPTNGNQSAYTRSRISDSRSGVDVMRKLCVPRFRGLRKMEEVCFDICKHLWSAYSRQQSA